VYLVVVTHARAVADADEGEDDAVVANHHVAFDIGEGEYLTVFADFRSGVDLGFGTYFAHNCLFYCELVLC
jgi:hypothetical protein